MVHVPEVHVRKENVVPRKGLKYITVYVSSEQKTQLTIEAIKAGKSMSKYIFDRLFEAGK